MCTTVLSSEPSSVVFFWVVGWNRKFFCGFPLWRRGVFVGLLDSGCYDVQGGKAGGRELGGGGGKVSNARSNTRKGISTWFVG